MASGGVLDSWGGSLDGVWPETCCTASRRPSGLEDVGASDVKWQKPLEPNNNFLIQ